MGLEIGFFAVDSTGKDLGYCSSGGRSLYDDIFDGSSLIKPYLSKEQASLLVLAEEKNKEKFYPHSYVASHSGKEFYELVYHLVGVMKKYSENLPLYHWLGISAGNEYTSEIAITDNGELYTVRGHHRNTMHRDELQVCVGRGHYWERKEYEWITASSHVEYRSKEIFVRSQTMYERYEQELIELLDLSKLAYSGNGKIDVFYLE